MCELHVPIPKPLLLFCDDMSATFIISNPLINDKSKHIQIDFYFVKEQVEAVDLLVKFIRSQYQCANMFTNVIGIPRFQFLKDKLHVHQCPLAARGY